MFILEAIHEDILTIQMTVFADVGYIILPSATGKQCNWKLYKVTLNGKVLYETTTTPLTFDVGSDIRCNIHGLAALGLKVGDELSWDIFDSGSLVLRSHF